METYLEQFGDDKPPVKAFLGVLPFTPICVDCFTVSSGVSLYFLTHFHADHFPGLSNSWNSGIIYCSSVTRTFLLKKFPKIEHSKVRALDYGTHFIHMVDHTKWATKELFPGNQDEILQVSLFPSQHCPGSVVFIFEGYFGKYVYTGDMRLELDVLIDGDDMTKPNFVVDTSINEDDSLIPWNKMYNADRLFLDTTFAYSLWDSFPSRIDAILQVVSLIETQSKPNQLVFLEASMLGTEQVLIGVSEHFKSKIYAEPPLYSKLILVPGLASVLTRNVACTRFRAVSHGSFSRGHLDSGKSVNSIKRSISAYDPLCIKPSTQWFGQQVSTKFVPTNPKPLQVNGVWHVLYSIHSSFKEIKCFINRVRPKIIVPLVDVPVDSMELFRLASGSLNTSNLTCNIPEKLSYLIKSRRSHIELNCQAKSEDSQETTNGYDPGSHTDEDIDQIDFQQSTLDISVSIESSRELDSSSQTKIDPALWISSEKLVVRSLLDFEEESDDHKEHESDPEVPLSESFLNTPKRSAPSNCLFDAILSDANMKRRKSSDLPDPESLSLTYNASDED